MKKLNALLFPFFLALLVIKVAPARAQEVHIKVTAIRSAKGKLLFSVFKDSQSYTSEKPYKKFVVDKKGLANGTLKTSYQLEPGTYGIIVVDDENENGKIDKNFIGMPKEGFGFSDFFLGKLKKPAFDEFKFELSPAHDQIMIKVKYM
ncbi:DUF2141 domain-containing protein [Mucilaginibacter sp. SMC90]|uniref:DUF2141 domain-containing protein n=1 Tax=Mucilaginibacter sp. SMC90 TaxID=2929803 RepID=UPI001FB262E8|nr:DUF2141 domain-containing protein [Mucilaginibacter sp. SMC90]UOE49808.1 DUF2141 domain-containing protein [Mucilaginibacter sp. SMC90]